MTIACRVSRNAARAVSALTREGEHLNYITYTEGRTEDIDCKRILLRGKSVCLSSVRARKMGISALPLGLILRLCLLLTAHGIITEEPQDKFVFESETAVFCCQTDDPSYKIDWIVNNTPADYRIFHEKGVSIVHINSTSSQLHIVAYITYNNTSVQCVARLFLNHIVVDYDVSDVVYLGISLAHLEVSQSVVSIRNQSSTLTALESMTSTPCDTSIVTMKISKALIITAGILVLIIGIHIMFGIVVLGLRKCR